MVEIVKKYETGVVVKCVHCNETGVCTHSSETREKIPGWDRKNSRGTVVIHGDTHGGCKTIA